MPPFFTGKGDDGTTGILGEGRVPKYHPRPEAYGTVDEASAAIGLARASAHSEKTRHILLEIQRDLYHLMAELAAAPEVAGRFRRIDEGRVEWLEQQLAWLEERVEAPNEFIVPGDSLSGAALDLARTVVRRAERLVARLDHQGAIQNHELLRYLNRLSSLCFILGLWETGQAGVDRPSLARRDAP
jgi:cob(I)alamin adenosyltransferase